MAGFYTTSLGNGGRHEKAPPVGQVGLEMPEPLGQTTQIQDWLSRLRQGDESAREELIRQATERLRRLAHRMLRSYPGVRRWEETDDVLNNAMLRLHRALADVKPESVKHFFRLAYTQIRRELIDLAKHYYGPEGMGAHHATDGVSPDTGARPRHDVSQDTYEPTKLSEWAEFHQQVEALPEKEREVFSLRWYEALNFAEIAEVVGATDRTAKRRWRSACVMLYKAMQGEAPGS